MGDRCHVKTNSNPEEARQNSCPFGLNEGAIPGCGSKQHTGRDKAFQTFRWISWLNLILRNRRELFCLLQASISFGQVKTKPAEGKNFFCN